MPCFHHLPENDQAEISITQNIPTHFLIYTSKNPSITPNKKSWNVSGGFFLSPESTWIIWFILIPCNHVLLLVQTGEGSIHSLVQAPALRHGDVHLICSLQCQIAGLDGTSDFMSFAQTWIAMVYCKYIPMWSNVYKLELYTALGYSYTVSSSSDRRTLPSHASNTRWKPCPPWYPQISAGLPQIWLRQGLLLINPPQVALSAVHPH